MSELSQKTRLALDGDEDAAEELGILGLNDLDDTAYALCDEVEKLEQERDEALDVLRELHDWQNGCPLPSYEKGWGAAMQRAKQLFKKHGV